MEHSILVAASLAALVIFVAPAPVFAADASCVWDHLPAGRSADLLEAGLNGDLSKIHDVAAGREMVLAAKACGFGARPMEVVGNAFIGVALQRVSEAWFQRKRNIGPDRLDWAWHRLEPDTQAALTAEIASPTIDAALNSRVADVLIVELGLGDPKDMRQDEVNGFIGLYMAGRSFRAANEPKL